MRHHLNKSKMRNCAHGRFGFIVLMALAIATLTSSSTAQEESQNLLAARTQSEEADHQPAGSDGSLPDVWLGWRGLERDGNAPEARVPTQWGESKNIKWKVDIEGNGYSSPVVDIESVYITTAYETKSSEVLRQCIRALLLFLYLVVLISASHFVVARCRDLKRNAISVASLILFEILVLVLGGFVLFGENVLNYSGSRDVRSWLSSGLGIVLCLSLLQFYAPRRRSVIISVSTALFLGLYVAAIPMPTREYLFDGTLIKQPFSNDSVVVFSIPALLLSLIAWRLIYSFIEKRRKSTWELSNNLNKNFLNNYVAVKIGTWAIVLVTFLISGAIVRSSDYLTHHVMERIHLAPSLGWWSLYLVAALYVVSEIISIRSTKSSIGEVRDLPDIYRWMIITLATLIFVGLNFISNASQLTRSVIAIDRSTGEIRWSNKAFTSALGQMNTFNSPATPTSVIDDNAIYSYFGSAGLVAIDKSGKTIWKNQDYTYKNVYGTAVSPVISNDILVLVIDTPENPFIVGIDAKSGQEIWKQSRDNKGFSFNGVSRTPLIREVDSRMYVFVWGAKHIHVYDLLTGAKVWSFLARLGGSDRVASPLSHQDRLYLIGKQKALCLDMNAIDKVTEPIVWESGRISGPNCATPVLANGLIFSVSDWGIVTCIESATGEVLWEKELEGEFYSSPIAAGGSIYISSTSGSMIVISAEKEYRELFRFQFPDKIFASPAAAGRSLFVRTERTLYCIE